MNHLVGQLFLLAVAVVSATGGIYATVANRKKTSAEAGKTEAEKQHVSDATWIRRIEAISRDLGNLQTLSDERFERLVELERLITEHVAWDFKMVRLARQHGWDVDDPPSLVYVKRKLAEEKNAIKKEMGERRDEVGGEEIPDGEH